MATISRAEMEAAIRSGGCVLLPSGMIASRIEHLPSEATLAVGDPVKEAAAAVSLQDEIDKLKADLARLLAGQPKPAEPVKTESVKVEPVKVTPGPAAVARVSSPAMVPTKAAEPEKAK